MGSDCFSAAPVLPWDKNHFADRIYCDIVKTVRRNAIHISDIHIILLNQLSTYIHTGILQQ